MTADELDKKIIQIKKKGLHNILENEMIVDLRREYYKILLKKKVTSISRRFRENVLFLNKVHKKNCSAGRIREFMGFDMPKEFNDILYKEGNIYSLRQAIICAEFFGLPVELLLFTDLSQNEDALKQEYPALFRQSRS